MPRSLDGLALAGKRVLLRGDLNVPMKDGAVADTARLDRLAPTVEEICAKGASVVLLSHFGRPGGERVPALSLRALAGPLSRALGGRRVGFAEDCIGPLAEQAAAGLGPGGVLLLENLRFHPGEEADDPGFAAALAALGDVYVNDAFSAAHRAHASTSGLARLLPAAAGRLMEAELAALESALATPDRPLAAIVGGAKISTKLDLLGNLAGRVDTLVIGGAMANTVLHALGTDVGASLCERGMAGAARALLAAADEAGCEVALPSDVVVARALEAGAPAETVPVAAVPRDAMILDLGPATANALAARLAACRTLVWNGPLGAFEMPPFDAATVAVARRAAALTKAGSLRSIAGGGDTVAALSHAGVADDFSYLSTAGGAFLEWLEGRTLPGVAALGG
ncbi:MAG: phosphoglycerate kinase [Defluviicoccus sp.]|nr:phosphoglycerate kinase [Defluviicoccus sp.]